MKLEIILQPTWEQLADYGATLKRCCSGRDCGCQGDPVCDDDDQALERMYEEMSQYTTMEEVFDFLNDTGIPHTLEWL